MNKIYLLLLLIISLTSANAQTGNIIVQNGHALKIEKIIRDKQGKYLYTLENAKVIMWDFKTHDQLYTFPINAKDVSGFDVSNDGKMIAVAYQGFLKCFSTVTGKALFDVKRFNYRSEIKFSTDDSKIYSVDDGIVSVDVASQAEAKLISNGFDNFHSYIDIIDAGHVVIRNNTGWQIWDITEKKMDFEYKFISQTFKSFYLPLLHCIANSSASSNLEFRDLTTGKLVKSIPVLSNDYKIIPSIDTKEFILDNGKFENYIYTLYDGSKFLPVRSINTSVSNWNVSGGYFSGKREELYALAYADVLVLNTKTNKKTGQFKRQVANLGMDVFSSLEYNKADGILNFIADDTVFKSVNLLKLVPFRHKPLPINSDLITFSATGDTIAAFFDHKGYIKNIVTGKFLQPAIKLIEEASTTERTNYFFSSNGAYVYYTTFSVPKQTNTLNKINVKTGLSEKVISFRGSHSANLHPDKDLLAFIEQGYQYTHVKVWNIITNKLLFDKNVPPDENCSFVSLAADKKKILIVRNNQTEIYDLSSGNLLSTSKEYASLGQFGIYSCSSDLSILFQCEANGHITAFDLKGELLYSIAAHSSSIRNALVSQDNKILYTISNDQSIKVWQAKTGKLYGTLYLFNDGNDYVFLDAYGHFDGTESGMKRMYYFRDRVKIALDVVYEKYYTPNLYQRLINGEVFEPIDIIINPQPKVRISYAAVTRNLNVEDDTNPTYQNTTGISEITVNASAENDKVDEIRLFHNGKIVNLATRGLFVTNDLSGNETKKYTINLLAGMNSIRAIALNSQRTESEPDEIAVNYANGSPQANTPIPIQPNATGIISPVDKNATLYLVVVGINKYQNEKLSLNYALADATAFKEEVEKDGRTMVSDLKTYFVTDEKANKDGITAAFAEVQKNAKAQDVFVFYYAGHGVISDKNKEFYLVPTDIADLKNVDEALQQRGIASKMLQEYAINIQAQKQLFILDACQSAGAFDAMLASNGNQQKSMAVVARSTGTHWIAASGSQQFANEFSQLGHGAFTYVLLQGMKGEAASNKMITVNGLKNFLQDGVPALMKKYNGSAQFPASYGLGNDFPVEVLK